ncbi:hypothetical protein H5410_032203 [Solanum commersonii]|uniref:Uncharacterized protein n=1 Tax=Solanum commersonii TaxID=4109 RepID=A0A9J5YKF7_SOLCO|nr:hypothetical protein H5410_032203 [Solanum commersonii]
MTYLIRLIVDSGYCTMDIGPCEPCIVPSPDSCDIFLLLLISRLVKDLKRKSGALIVSSCSQSHRSSGLAALGRSRLIGDCSLNLVGGGENEGVLIGEGEEDERKAVDTMATKYLNLRFKFGGILVSEVGPVYVGGGDMVELKNDMNICNIALFMHDGDTIDIYMRDDTILEDMGPTEGQISQSLSQVIESFNTHGKYDGSLTAQPKNPHLGLGSSSSFPSSESVENDGVARVQQEIDDDYSSIDWTDTEEEEDIDNDSICSDQFIDYGSDVHEEFRIVKEDTHINKLATKLRGIKRRKKFWACARSTFEAQSKYNINALSKMRTCIVEALIKYNKEKCIANNMAESFNAWILGLRNNIIITILEEIRVKAMSRVSKLRAFADTWTNGISPMAMMLDASQAISSWYRKETYLKTYSHFIQPVPNMEMWPESRNLIVEPPEARQMPGRPPKNRIREIGEVRKAGKLPRMGTIMTCSICRGANHNKRNCPKNSKPKSTPTSTQESTTGKKKGRGQYKRASNNNTGTRRGQKLWDKMHLLLILDIHVLIRRVNTSAVSSAHVTGDIDFKPTKGLKWKGKQAMTQRELQVQSVMHRIQIISKGVGIQTRAQAKEKSPSKKTS